MLEKGASSKIISHQIYIFITCILAGSPADNAGAVHQDVWDYTSIPYASITVSETSRVSKVTSKSVQRHWNMLESLLEG